jgi:hypothetical protein
MILSAWDWGVDVGVVDMDEDGATALTVEEEDEGEEDGSEVEDFETGGGGAVDKVEDAGITA